MQVSAAGIKLVMSAEGFRGRVYKDVCGYPSIGYGHKLLHSDSFPDGISEATAQHMLSCDLDDAEAAVEKLVRVPLTQGQFDALVDFVFNLGAVRLAGSTMRKLLNECKYDAASEQLARWDHADIDGAEQEINALKARREAEYVLWHFVPIAQEIAA
jgi:lysozyme